MKYFLFFFFIIFTQYSYSQAPDWLWAKSEGGTSYDWGRSCSTDINGNIIATGSFASSSITFGTTALMNAGSRDMFIVKYDINGNVLWAISAGGTSDDYSFSCSTDANGNIIATGSFASSSITFGAITLNNDTTDGSPDIFIVKYNSLGNALWAKSAGGTGGDGGYSCSTDANGNIIATGDYLSSFITFGTTTLTNAGSYDMFIVKYDQNGNLLWAKNHGGAGSDQGISCSTDANSNIIATGSFWSSPITFGTTTLTSEGAFDIFIVKYDPSGNVLWAKSAGGTGWDGGYSCSTDANGNIIATGFFASYSIAFGTTAFTNAGNYDMFIAKYDPNGNLLWAKSAGGTSNDVGYSCSTDANGNIITTGYFASSSIPFGITTLNNNTSNGSTDIFIVKYNSNGNVLWAKSAGGTSGDEGYSCSTDASDNIIATGLFYSSSITIGSFTLTNAGGNDMFIVKLNGFTGIAKNNFNNEINIFPNPTTGKFQIQVGNRQSHLWRDPSSGGLAVGKEYKIEIYNVLGEKIYSTANMNCETPNEIDLSNRPEGIYFYKINNGAELHTGKLLCE